MSEVLIVDADTGSVAKRKPAQRPGVDGVDEQLVQPQREAHPSSQLPSG